MTTAITTTAIIKNDTMSQNKNKNSPIIMNIAIETIIAHKTEYNISMGKISKFALYRISMKPKLDKRPVTRTISGEKVNTV